eukprot:1187241-Prorocentrum_minimum.AAC.1
MVDKGERSGRKWGTEQGGEKRGRVSGVLSAPLPLLAQEDLRCPATAVEFRFQSGTIALDDRVGSMIDSASSESTTQGLAGPPRSAGLARER